MELTSIRNKILVLGGACLLLTAAIVVTYAVMVMKRNAHMGRQQAMEVAAKYAVAQAKQQANYIRADLEVALDTARVLADTLAAVRDEKFDIEIGRAEVIGLLKSVLEKNPQFVGIYTAWEPDAFDQLDMAFANTEGHDASGRFIPYWSRSESGQILLEPLIDYESEGLGDYYQVPKNTHHECIIDPSFYN